MRLLPLPGGESGVIGAGAGCGGSTDRSSVVIAIVLQRRSGCRMPNTGSARDSNPCGSDASEREREIAERSRSGVKFARWREADELRSAVPDCA